MVSIKEISKLPIISTIVVIALISVAAFPPVLLLFKLEPVFFIETDLSKILLLTWGFGSIVLILNIALVYKFFIRNVNVKEIEQKDPDDLKGMAMRPLLSAIIFVSISYIVVSMSLDSKLITETSQAINSFIVYNTLLLVVYYFQTKPKKLSPK